MTRINTNVNAVCARRNHLRAQNDLQKSLQRLSSGLEINRGADNPAGLIVSERLRSEISGVGQGINNSLRAANVVATAEGALNEISTLLVDIHDLVLEAANSGALSPAEIAANQLQVDSAVQSINRIANTTEFAGKKLIDGSLQYSLSGVEQDVFASVQVHAAKINDTQAMPVNVRIVAPTSSHQDAFWASGHPASLLFPQPCNNFLSINSTLEITGPNGTASLNFPAGTGNSANIISAVNTATPTTGITAGIAGDGVSIAFNGNGRIEIKQLPPCPNHQFQDQDGNTNIDTETTVTPARVFINGVEYPIDENNNVYVNTPYLCMDMGLTQLGASINLASTFYITDGGALFQTGAVVDGQNQVRIAIPSVAPSALGNGTVGYLNQIVQSSDYALTDGHAQEADAIVLEAIRQVSVLRGRLGAFEKDILQTSVNANQITLENVTSSESRVRDTDFAIETSKMARAQILDKSGTSVMNIANHTSETILNLLKTNL